MDDEYTCEYCARTLDAIDVVDCGPHEEGHCLLCGLGIDPDDED